MKEPVFTPENFKSLKKILNNLEYLCDEQTNGVLMATQLVMLGEQIKDFIAHPIVSASGVAGPYSEEDVINLLSKKYLEDWNGEYETAVSSMSFEEAKEVIIDWFNENKK